MTARGVRAGVLTRTLNLKLRRERHNDCLQAELTGKADAKRPELQVSMGDRVFVQGAVPESMCPVGRFRFILGTVKGSWVETLGRRGLG